jgi:hypothetical protein
MSTKTEQESPDASRKIKYIDRYSTIRTRLKHMKRSIRKPLPNKFLTQLPQLLSIDIISSPAEHFFRLKHSVVFKINAVVT